MANIYGPVQASGQGFDRLSNAWANVGSASMVLTISGPLPPPPPPHISINSAANRNEIPATSPHLASFAFSCFPLPETSCVQLQERSLSKAVAFREKGDEMVRQTSKTRRHRRRSIDGVQRQRRISLSLAQTSAPYEEAPAYSGGTRVVQKSRQFLPQATAAPSCGLREDQDANLVAYPSAKRRTVGRIQPITIWQALLLLLVSPHLLASLANTASSTQAITAERHGAFGVFAATNIESRSVRNAQAAAFAAAESFQAGQQKQQPLLASAWTSSQTSASSNDTTALEGAHDLSPLSVVGEQSLGVVNRTRIMQVSVESLLEQRWGQSAAFLPDSNVVLFTGGQIADAQGYQAVTNDVFALDMANSTVANDSSSDARNWIRLSSSHLPPHAYAARAVTHTGDHKGERLFLIGGATADCSISNSPVYIWTPGKDKGWHSGRWSAPTIAAKQIIPPRRRGAMAIQVPVSLGLNATAAAQARKQGGTAFMVLGGFVDYTTCNASAKGDAEHPAEYPYVDVWTIGTTDGGGISKRSSQRTDEDETLTVRTIPLDARMPNMSVIDYSSVVLPANQTAKLGSRVLFIGGRDSFGAFTPMNQLWSLDVESNKWQRMDTTNGSNTGLDIPLGRMGHSSTLLEDGTVLVHGGYVTLDADQHASNDTYLLDPRVAPAVWYRVTPKANDGSAPRRAYHSAVMANGIFILGFGQEGTGTMATSTSAGTMDDDSGAKVTGGRQAAQSPTSTGDGKSLNTANTPVHYLDTQATNDWTWMTSLQSVMAVREKMASASSAEGQASDSSTTPEPASTAEGMATSDNTAKTNGQSSNSAPQESQARAESTPVADPQHGKAGSEPAPTNGDQQQGDGGTSSKQRNTAVIASVLGAAALAASLGGLYAARRRQARLNDADSVGDDDRYERFDSNATAGHAAPPVSSLWINQPIAWANNAGRGLKRHASLASEAFLARTMSMRNADAQSVQAGHANIPVASRWRGAWRTSSSPVDGDGMRYSSPNGSLRVLGNLPPTSRLSMRRSEMQRQRDIRAHLSDHDGEDDEKMVDVMLGSEDARDETPLPEEFIQTLLDDDDVRAQQDIQRTVGGADRIANLARDSSLARMPSTKSLSSVDGASHFSYPYLAAMHRPSIGDLSASNTQGLSPTSSQGAGLGQLESPQRPGHAIVSPREALLRASQSRSPNGQPLYAMTAAAVTAQASAWSRPAVNYLMGGKNARLGERVHGEFVDPQQIRFQNPFTDAHQELPPTSPLPQASIAQQAEEGDRATELDLSTTVLGGEEGRPARLPGSPTHESPSLSSALFPWDPSRGLDASPSTPRQSPGRQLDGRRRLSPDVQPSPYSRLPMYAQPSTGIHLPIHPALLSAAAQRSGQHPSQRDARPSLLRVTNQTDDPQHRS